MEDEKKINKEILGLMKEKLMLATKAGILKKEVHTTSEVKGVKIA